jgi:preprotein translocase SecE subunit
VARNRKRAKERQARQPQPVPSARSARDDDAAPQPLAHAAPDAELADAQLALGRPELAPQSDPSGEEFAQDDDFVDDDEFDDEAPADGGGGRGGRLRGLGDRDADGDGDGGYGGGPGGGAVAVGAGAAPVRGGNRLINFLQGSWRELQRVQWPDRRQVIQATGVVLGFVIVAGVFLGVADFLAGHVMNYVLQGHW